MILTVLSEETSKLALRDYLNKTSYSTARPTDLWASFEPYVSISINQRNVTLEEVMDTWTNQPGYPIVHATLKYNTLYLYQVISVALRYMCSFLNILFEYVYSCTRL